MSEISSGLVAVAEVGAGFSLRWTEPDYGCSCKHYDMLVRLSDAEAKPSAATTGYADRNYEEGTQ